MRPGTLSPAGTAAVRQRLASAGAAGAPPPGPRVSPALRERAASFDLGDEALYLAWELGRCVTGLAATEEEALFVLVLATLANHRRGSSRLPLGDEASGPARDLCAELGGPDTYAVARALLADPRLGPIVGRPGAYKPLILDGGALYHHRLRGFEERLARGLRPRLGAPGAAAAATVAAALQAVLAHPPRRGGQPVTLSAEQQEAVRRAVQAPLTVITGGPGTGKTSIVVSILRVLLRLGVPPEAVALAAPTGKAARRLQESIVDSLASIAAPGADDQALAAAVEPRTLHRLLGAARGGDRFRHHEHNRLAEQVVIVDECSMVDLVLMDRLVRALRDDALLVLLGDAEQLPSVDAGAVFRDLCPAAAGAGAIRLTHSYRMDAADPAGRAILTVAGLVNEGRAAELLAAGGAAVGGAVGDASGGDAAGGGTPAPVVLRALPADLAFAGVELVPGAAGGDPGGAAGLRAFLAHWFERRVASLPGFVDLVRRTWAYGPGGFAPADAARLDALFAHYDAHRILCVTRGDERPTGAAAVNACLHAHLLALTAPDDDGARRAELLVGGPIMMQRNDYERGLFNGDPGLVLWVRLPGAPGDQAPMAVFRRGAGDYGVFHLGALRGHLERAFAVTVHKGQGAEFDHVAVVLPGEWLPLCTREILYTAMTRSRHSVVLCGAPEVLLEGVRRRAERYSGLAERLAAPAGPESCIID